MSEITNYNMRMTEEEFTEAWIKNWADHTGKSPDEIKDLALVKERIKENNERGAV